MESMTMISWVRSLKRSRYFSIVIGFFQLFPHDGVV
jgi:hypothetical protein